MRHICVGLGIALMLAGCGDPPTGGAGRNSVTVATPTVSTTVTPLPPPADAVQPPASATPVTDAWIGRWVGVEGLVLTIARGDRPATYRLHIVLLDGANDYIGTAAGETIRFERDGEVQAIRHSTGDETGLKWLAGKADCLVIRPGEGFCRG